MLLSFFLVSFVVLPFFVDTEMRHVFGMFGEPRYKASIGIDDDSVLFVGNLEVAVEMCSHVSVWLASRSTKFQFLVDLGRRYVYNEDKRK